MMISSSSSSSSSSRMIRIVGCSFLMFGRGSFLATATTCASGTTVIGWRRRRGVRRSNLTAAATVIVVGKDGTSRFTLSTNSSRS